MSDSEDRRSYDVNEAAIKDIWTTLRSVETTLNNHITEENIYKPQLLEAIEVMKNTKGVLAFLRGLFYILAPLGAFAVWAKEHIKL